MIDTTYDKSPVGSFSSYQLGHTEPNFEVTMNTSTVAKNDSNTKHLLVYPRFPLTSFGEFQVHDLNDQQEELVKNVQVSEEEIKNIKKD